MTSWSIAFSWPALLLGLVFLAVTTWLSQQQYRRTGRRQSVRWLEVLRWLIVLLLFLTLLQPELRKLINPTVKPEVVVLCDRSRSMETEDVVTASNTLSRAAWLSQQRAGEFWKPIESRYTVKVEEFASPPTNRTDAAAETAEEGTDINGALDGAMTGTRNLRAVVLLTDGDWNLGKSPITAATRMQVAGVPVFAISVGSEKYLPDLALVNVAVPAYGLVGEQVFIPFTVRSHLGRDVKTRVQLLAAGAEATSKEIIIPANGQVQDGVLWFPQRDGPTTLTLKFPVERDELRADNNQQNFTINIRRETLRVLVIDSLPRWEYRFLRNALSRDPSVEVRCLLFLPGLKAGGGRDYIDRFPETKDKLSVFDVVFIGDVGIGENELTKEQAELLKGLVEQQGSGLVFMPGRRGLQATLQDTALASICPVILDASKPKGLLTVEPATLNLTRLGRSHLLTRLANSEEANALVWKTLPGFSWCAGVERARPGSEVLGVHESLNNAYGRLPLLVTRPAGNGKTLFLGTDSAWRWRRGVEDRYHYRFWGQVVRWMSYQRHRAHDEGFRLAFTPDSPTPGDTVAVSATAFDELGQPLSDAMVTVEVTTPKGNTSRQTLTPVPGGWGVYQGQFVTEQRGKYPIKVSSDQTKRSMQTELEVRGVVREEVGRPAQPGSLKEIAVITRGRYGEAADLAAFIDTLATMPEPEPMEQRIRVWSSPWWGALLLLLLTVYWVGRKLSGLV
jgi:uncharacterized membrane protein